MLEGVNSEDKEAVTTVKGVIKAVLDGVKVGCKRRVASLLASVTQDLVPEPNTLEPHLPASPVWVYCSVP